jgi:hypothetical protein
MVNLSKIETSRGETVAEAQRVRASQMATLRGRVGRLESQLVKSKKELSNLLFFHAWLLMLCVWFLGVVGVYALKSYYSEEKIGLLTHDQYLTAALVAFGLATVALLSLVWIVLRIRRSKRE